MYLQYSIQKAHILLVHSFPIFSLYWIQSPEHCGHIQSTFPLSSTTENCVFLHSTLALYPVHSPEHFALISSFISYTLKFFSIFQCSLSIRYKLFLYRVQSSTLALSGTNILTLHSHFKYSISTLALPVNIRDLFTPFQYSFQYISGSRVQCLGTGMGQN